MPEEKTNGQKKPKGPGGSKTAYDAQASKKRLRMCDRLLQEGRWEECSLWIRRRKQFLQSEIRMSLTQADKTAWEEASKVFPPVYKPQPIELPDPQPGWSDEKKEYFERQAKAAQAGKKPEETPRKDQAGEYSPPDLEPPIEDESRSTEEVEALSEPGPKPEPEPEPEPEPDPNADLYIEQFFQRGEPTSKEQDAEWVYHHLGAQNVTHTDAPSPGAWELLLWARDDRKKFFETVLPRLAKREQSEDELKQIRNEEKSIAECKSQLKQHIRATNIRLVGALKARLELETDEQKSGKYPRRRKRRGAYGKNQLKPEGTFNPEVTGQ